MRIALDVDGVLADVIVSWLNYSNTIRPKISKSQITDWKFWREFEINEYDFYAELSACWKDWQVIPPTETNLSSTTKILSSLGQLDIVTAREKSTDGFVKSWMAHYNISYDNYISVIHGPMKVDLDYDVFIDDSPVNAMMFLQRNKKVILYPQPWNQHVFDERVCRVSNLSQAADMIQSNLF